MSYSGVVPRVCFYRAFVCGRLSTNAKGRHSIMVLASCCGGLYPLPDTPTLADLLMQSRTALACAILLLGVVFVLGIVYRRDRWRLWPRKTILFSVATSLLALAIAQQTWSLHQSIIQDGLSPNATYRDVYTRINEATANHLDLAVGTFSMWSITLVFGTMALLCAAMAHIVKTLRTHRPDARSAPASSGRRGNSSYGINKE